MKGLRCYGLRIALWAAIIVNAIDGMGSMFVEPILPYYMVHAMSPWERKHQALLIASISASYALSQTIFGLVLGKLSDSIGRKPVLVGGLIGATCMYVMQGLVVSVWPMFAVRLVLGAVCSTEAVSEGYVLDETETDQERTRAMSMDMALGSMASAMGAAVGSILYSNLGGGLEASLADNERAWRYVNFMMAGICLFEVCVGMVFFDQTKGGKVTDEGEETEDNTATQKKAANPWKDPVIRLAFGSELLESLASMMALTNFVFLLKNQYEFSPKDQGRWQATFGICGFLTTFLADWQIRFLGKRFCILANDVVFPVMLVFVLWAASQDLSFWWWSPYILVALEFFGPAGDIAETLLFAKIIPEDRMGEVYGVFGALGAGCAVLGVPLSGWLYDVWWMLPFIIGISLQLVNLPLSIKLINAAAEREKQNLAAESKKRWKSAVSKITAMSRIQRSTKPAASPGGVGKQQYHREQSGTLKGAVWRSRSALLSSASLPQVSEEGASILKERLLR